MTDADNAAASSNPADLNGTDLTPIDPRYIPVNRIANGIGMAALLTGVIIAEAIQFAPIGVFLAPWLILTIFVVGIVPVRKYRRWGYDMGTDRIRIVRGYLFHSDTIVPFGRIQHIDVEQGPIQRSYDLATLTVHTAGNHNSSVDLPCLAHEDARALRETIREHIKRDTR